MNVPGQDVTARIDALIEGAKVFEERLAKADISEAHAWMFAVREMLLDLRRLELMLANMYSVSDVHQTPALMQSLVETILYQVIPHVQGHMTELEEKFPQEDTQEENDSTLG